MILIRSKPGYENCACQDKQSDEAFSVQRLDEKTLSSRASLPVVSNHPSDRSGVAGGEIAGSDTASDVGAFGKVPDIFTASPEGTVSAGSGGGEGTDFAKFSEEFQRPFSVDPLNRSEGDLVAEKGINNHNKVIVDLNLGLPEQAPNHVANKCCSGKSLQRTQKTQTPEVHSKTQQHCCCGDSGQQLTKSGSEYHDFVTLEGSNK